VRPGEQEKNNGKGPPKSMLLLMTNLGVLALRFLIAQPDFLIVNPDIAARMTAEQGQGWRGSDPHGTFGS
jgi:hypothetical protein